MTDRIVYVDSETQKLIDSEFELISDNDWYLLYQSKLDKSYWRLDKYDRLQQQYLVRIDDFENWDKFDDKELRIELLKTARGTDKKKCIWSQCGRVALVGLAYCERHAYEEMGIRR